MKSRDNLNVEKVLKEFRQYEESKGHRKGTFKLDVPFEQAVKKIATAKPPGNPNAAKKRGKP